MRHLLGQQEGVPGSGRDVGGDTNAFPVSVGDGVDVLILGDADEEVVVDAVIADG